MGRQKRFHIQICSKKVHNDQFWLYSSSQEVLIKEHLKEI